MCRLLLAATFVLSGYVKAIDPLGTQYKIDDYVAAVGLSGTVSDWFTLFASVALSATEFAGCVSALRHSASLSFQTGIGLCWRNDTYHGVDLHL